MLLLGLEFETGRVVGQPSVGKEWLVVHLQYPTVNGQPALPDKDFAHNIHASKTCR